MIRAYQIPNKSQRLTIMDYARIAYGYKPENVEIRGLRTLIQEHLFPTIIKSLLGVLILISIVDGCECRDVLHHQDQSENRKD